MNITYAAEIQFASIENFPFLIKTFPGVEIDSFGDVRYRKQLAVT